MRNKIASLDSSFNNILNSPVLFQMYAPVNNSTISNANHISANKKLLTRNQSNSALFWNELTRNEEKKVGDMSKNESNKHLIST